MIEISRLHELFELTPYGKLLWKINRKGGAKAGDSVGSLMKLGYLITSVDGNQLYVHRIVWALAHGVFPDGVIDHINGNKLDNRVCNLRACTRGQNKKNSIKTWAKSGLKGAFYDKFGNRWYSSIKIEDRIRHLGYFSSAKAAHLAFKNAVVKYHGEYGPRSYHV